MKSKYLAVALSAVALVACNNEDVLEVNQGRGISFQVATEASTRATATTTNTISEFNVWGFTDANETLMNDVKVTGSNESGWSYGATIFWPNAGTVDFYAVSPKECGGAVSVTSSAKTITDFTVNADVTKQVDLLAYWKTDVPGAKSTTAYNLEFNHLCTAVKFKVGKNLESAIRTISIKNVYGSGTYSADTGEWEQTGEADQTYTFNANRGIVDEEGYELNTGERIFMMIPQTLNSEAALEVTFYNGSTLTGSLADKEWKKGYTVVYTISASEIIYDYILTGPTEGFTFNHFGGKQEAFSITSYKQKEGDESATKVPVAWTADFVEKKSDGTYEKIDCDWVTDFNNSSDNTANNVRSFSVSAQVETNLGNIEDKELQSITDYANDKDLSLVNGTMNTANCYIVNGPGTYKFPLVYGNAIKNSQTNENAYTCESVSGLGSYDKFLKTFVNHLDLAITSPFIEENEDAENTKLEAKGAKVVWYQGMENMITVDDNNALTSEKITVDSKEQTGKYLHFTVAGGQNIKQGNAIIAVTDAEGTTMWSWHIWVTPYKLEEEKITLSDYAGNSTVMMPHNIGYVTNDKIKYEGREVYLRITQSESPKDGEAQVLYIPIKQEGYERQNVGSNTLYQHGRKDPMPGPTKIYVTGENWIDKLETIVFGDYKEEKSGAASLGDAMQNPGTLYMSNTSTWTTETYYEAPLSNLAGGFYLRQIDNLWRSGKSGDSKSVYDPSPAGFMVPTMKDMEYFYWPTTKENHYKVAVLNTPWNEDEVKSQMALAFYIYKANSKDEGEKDEEAELIYFPLTGCKSTNSTETLYWFREKANNGTSDRGNFFVIQYNEMRFDPNQGSSIGITHAIRPVKEND